MDMNLPKELLERWNKLKKPEQNNQNNDEYWSKHNWVEKLNDRGKRVMDRNPSFFPDLMFILSGLEDEDVPDTEMQTDEAKQSRKTKDKMLRKFSAEEIKGLCKSRYSLMTLQDFLLILNRMNSASSGNLLRDK